MKTILLLLVGVALSTVLRINQVGLKYACYDGVVVLIAIVLLVFFASFRKYWQEQRAQKKLQNHQHLERGAGKVHVRRGGEPKVICESELVWGDILLIKKGDEVPCDGLFVGGEPLELDYGSESCTVNQHNPFLSFGERVVKGEARMVVTSPYLETEWSEMMSKDSGPPKRRFELEIQLDKLNLRMHDIQMVISILIILVLIFRYMAGHIDDENASRPESMAEPTAMTSFTNTFKKIIKESTYTTKVLTKLLCVSLVSLTEGVPFVVSLAIVYWNDKTLFGIGMEQDPHGIAKMAHVTRICTDTLITEDVMEVEKVFIGGETIGRSTALSPDVIEVLRDGTGTLNKISFPRVKDMFRFGREKGWRAINTKGAKSFDEPCGVLMRQNKENEELVWHFNGPVNEILNMCKHYYDIKGHKARFDDEMKQKFVQANQDNQHKHKLTTIALACKPVCAQTEDVEDLILIALLGLKTKNKEETNAQVRALRERGIKTVIVSSKKMSVLQDIARKCEVVANGESESLVMIRGKDFRNYTDKERLEKVDNIRVLGEALSSDKLLLVETMMEKGKVVAFLGHRTDEAPALKRAHIGIAMGTWSSNQAIDNSDIIMDGSFADLINMVDYGKCIYYNVQSFLQIVLNTTISCTLIGVIETAAFGDASLTTFQLAFINLAVAILGGLALLTKASTYKPLSLVPVSCEQSVITAEMARNILFQVSYQAICSVIIQLKGSAIVGPTQDIKSVISSILIFCQFFNLFNARELQKMNFFRGIHRHKAFWIATAMFIVSHAAFVMVQDIFGYGTRLEWKLLVGCVLLGAVSWLVDWLGKCVSLFAKILHNRLRRG
ncbi:putative P-type Ca(2+) transporter [Helianthus annuus]|nr:putative P-type Ca(2+) transporter [Helianthus annuus]